MTTEKYHGIGRVASVQENARLPTKFMRHAGHRLYTTYYVRSNAAHMKEMFEEAERMHPGMRDYAKHMTVPVENKLIGDIVALHRAIHDTGGPAMPQPAWNALAAHWLKANDKARTYRPVYVSAMAKLSDDIPNSAPQGFAVVDATRSAKHKLVIDITKRTQYDQKRVPAIFAVETANWDRLLEQGQEEERWLGCWRAWQGGVSNNWIYLGFAKDLNVAGIQTKLVNRKSAIANQEDSPQLKLFG